MHEPPAELLEGAPVAHGPQRAVELVVGHHQVLGVARHVDDLWAAGVEDTLLPGRLPRPGLEVTL